MPCWLSFQRVLWLVPRLSLVRSLALRRRIPAGQAATPSPVKTASPVRIRPSGTSPALETLTFKAFPPTSVSTWARPWASRSRRMRQPTRSIFTVQVGIRAWVRARSPPSAPRRSCHRFSQSASPTLKPNCTTVEPGACRRRGQSRQTQFPVFTSPC